MMVKSTVGSKNNIPTIILISPVTSGWCEVNKYEQHDCHGHDVLEFEPENRTLRLFNACSHRLTEISGLLSILVARMY